MQCSERRASVLRRARRPRHLRARLGGARLRREAAGRVAQHRRLCRTPWRATLLRPVPLLAIRECGRCRRSVPGERPVEGRGMSSPTLWSVRLRRQARRLALDLFGAREVRTLTPIEVDSGRHASPRIPRNPRPQGIFGHAGYRLASLERSTAYGTARIFR